MTPEEEFLEEFRRWNKEKEEKFLEENEDKEVRKFFYDGEKKEAYIIVTPFDIKTNLNEVMGKIDTIEEKLREAFTLINELAEMEVTVNFERHSFSSTKSKPILQ